MPRPRVTPAEDPLIKIGITIPTSMEQQLRAKKVNISDLIRRLLMGYLNSEPGEYEKVCKKLYEIEPEYLSLKYKKEEIEKRKQAAKSEEDQKQAKRDRWFKEIAELIKKYGREAYKLEDTVRQRAGYCGMSLDEFKAEFEKRYPGQISKVYHQPESRRPRQ